MTHLAPSAYDSARRLAHLEEIRESTNAAANRIQNRVLKVHEEIQRLEIEIHRQERSAHLHQRRVRGEPETLGVMPDLERRLKEAKALLADLIPKRDAASERFKQAAGTHQAGLEFAKANGLPTVLGHDEEGK